MGELGVALTIRAAENAGSANSFIYGSGSGAIGVLIAIGLLLLGYLLGAIVSEIYNLYSEEKENYHEAPDFGRDREESARAESDARDRTSESERTQGR